MLSYTNNIWNRKCELWLAGLVDSEGVIYFNSIEKNKSIAIEIYNKDKELLVAIQKLLQRYSYTPRIDNHRGGMWRLRMSRRKEVLDLLKEIPLKHGEKIMKKKLVSQIETRNLEEIKHALNKFRMQTRNDTILTRKLAQTAWLCKQENEKIARPIQQVFIR